MLRDGITSMLNEQADMHVVATIGSGNNVLLNAIQTKPHVILIDAGLKYFKEASVVESIKKNIPEAKLIGMGLLPIQADIVEFVEACASGFILKNATVKEVLSTIRSVVKGEKVLPPSLTGSLFFHVAELALKRINPNIIPLSDCLPFISLVYFSDNMGIVRGLSWNQI